MFYASPEGKARIDPSSAPDPDKLPPESPLFNWTKPEVARKVIALDKKLQAKGTLRLRKVHGRNYDAVIIVGGHGAMYDINQNPLVHKILKEAADKGKIIAAECHGTGTLAFADVIQGKRVTGFPNAWEPSDLRPKLPYILQDVLNKASGSMYEDGLSSSTAPAPFVIVQGNIITSRDPMSSEKMGRALLEELKKTKTP
ncbi:MAG: DJ-1/PfpI family protein [Elusimicrobia bacterium]|nr:DJ-1/PfpI family protein [Elusimicrobiota bacterium]